MGDDAELWLETGGDPTILIESYDYRYSYYGYDYNDIDDYDDFNDEIIEEDKRKKNTIVFIDAECISPNSCASIIEHCKNIGIALEMRYYARQNEASTKSWKDEAKKYNIKPILLCGGPEHNKVDKKIIKDIRKVLNTNKSIDIFCIATRDGDYAGIAKELRVKHKRVVILAPKQTSKKLKACASEVKGI